MRIVHVISNLSIGGAENALCTLIETDSDSARDHVVISVLPGGVFADRLRENGTRVVELSATRSLAMIWGFSQLAKAIAAEKPDIIQAWMYHANLAVSLAKLFGYTNAPVIWGIRQSLERLSGDKPTTVIAMLAAVLFRWQPRAIIYNSDIAALDHERYGYPATKRHVIPNLVDCDRFQLNASAGRELRSLLELPSDALVIGRVGRYARMKDNATLFAALALVRQALPQAVLITVGKNVDPQTPEIAELLIRFNLTGAVHFLGARNDIERVYPAFDVIVSSSSDREGFPNVIAEAMACGVPAVGTDVGSTRQIIGCKNGVVPPRNPDALAGALIKKLQLDNKQRQEAARAARDRIESRFGAQGVVREFQTIWGVIGKHPRS